MTQFYVNVYLVDRAYGGPEEGGWWFDYGLFQAEQSTSRHEEDAATREAERLQRWCDEENAQRRSDISSVVSEGRYVVYVEDEAGADWPAQRPHYE
jgi:hypothetical protein